jgi:hypothetical protein
MVLICNHYKVFRLLKMLQSGPTSPKMLTREPCTHGPRDLWEKLAITGAGALQDLEKEAQGL